MKHRKLGGLEAVVSVFMLVPGAALCIRNFGVFGAYYWVSIVLLFIGLYLAIDGANRLGLIAALFGANREEDKDHTN